MLPRMQLDDITGDRQLIVLGPDIAADLQFLSHPNGNHILIVMTSGGLLSPDVPVVERVIIGKMLEKYAFVIPMPGDLIAGMVDTITGMTATLETQKGATNEARTDRGGTS